MWNAPVPATTGELYAAARYNTDVVDNLLILKVSIADDGKLNSVGGLLTKPSFKNYTEKVLAAVINAGTGVLAIDLALAAEWTVAATRNITALNFTNIPSAVERTTFTAMFTADGTLRTHNWPASFRWGNAGAPIMSTTNGKVDTLHAYTINGGVDWFPLMVHQNA